MNDEESALAARLRAHAADRQGASIRSRDVQPQSAAAARRSRQRAAEGRRSHSISCVAGDRADTQLIATFYRPPAPPGRWKSWSAALVAIVAASSGRRLYRAARGAAAVRTRRAASVVARGGRRRACAKKGPDDVRNAAIAFNAMTDQVTRTLESQRQLLSAVGHDLRTPITAMRINLEFVEDDELRERLQNNLDELQELTEAVLSAARGAGGETKRNVDLSALVESLCADLDDLGEPVTWQTHPPAPLTCRPNEIRRAVRNLVENAVAYGGKASVGSRNTATAMRSWSRMKAPAFPKTIRAACSSPSCGWKARATPTPAAPGWA